MILCNVHFRRGRYDAIMFDLALILIHARASLLSHTCRLSTSEIIGRNIHVRYQSSDLWLENRLISFRLRLKVRLSTDSRSPAIPTINTAELLPLINYLSIAIKGM
jgi:hypothetical protein